VRALIATARPRQWTKNLLILAAPGAAGVLTHPRVIGQVALAFASFCLLASATYFVNDVRDRHEDRLHPKKRSRAIAAGELSPAVAFRAAAASLVLGLLLAWIVRPELAAVGAGYVVLTASYTLWWRRLALLDVGVISAGFVLRALAGGIATGVPVSHWFALTTSFGALFVASGKRHAELLAAGRTIGSRPSLGTYSRGLLRALLAIALAGALASYCVWAFAKSGHSPWGELTTLPFALWLLRYARLLKDGAGESPEAVVFSDRLLILATVLWLGLFVLGIYAGH